MSISTVSRALAAPHRVADATRIRVENVAERLGYRVNTTARSLITGRKRSIGLVVPDLENPFFGSVCKGVQARARQVGYSVFISDTEEDPALEAEVVSSLMSQVDGTILCSSRATDEELAGRAGHMPLVLANRFLSGIPSITFNNGGGLRAVMSHLVALGHRRIAYAAGPVRSWSNNERVAAFRAVGSADDRLELVELGNFAPTFAGGIQAGDIVAEGSVTALVAYNDIMALGLIDRLRQRGVSIPRDVSVTGFDNVAVSTLVRPNLTTVDLPRIQMGRMSVDALLELLACEPATHTSPVELPVELVVRNSTGVPGEARDHRTSARLIPAARDRDD